MKRIVLATLLLGASALVAPAAQAGSSDVILGGCSFNANGHATLTNGAYVGVIGDASVTTTGGFPGVPIGATVICWIEVNGVVAPDTTHSYGDVGGLLGVQAGSDPISYGANVGDVVVECQSVAFADGSSARTPCPPIENLQFPPQPVIDLLNDIFTALDPTVCPVLVALAGDYGSVTIKPDGDVHLADPLDLGLNPIYDCPPYQNF